MTKRNAVKNCIKKMAIVRVAYQLFQGFQRVGLPFRFVRGIVSLARFMREFREYRRRDDNPNFRADYVNIYPCLLDKTELTPLEPTYFFQDSWAAGKIFKNRPICHHDIGSSVKTVGIISQFVPTTMVDIRPIDLELPNLHFCKGSILDLPFPDDSVESISSLSVVEHIGLGRFGDPVDSWGSEKAAAELKRVLKPGGNLYFSVPVDDDCRVYFNAHRSFTRERVLKLFHGLYLVEEKYIYGRALCDVYDSKRGFGTGLYLFRKGAS